MSRGVIIREFEWRDENIEKLHRRGISMRDVEGLMDGRPIKIVRNKNNRAAAYKIIGQDQDGRLITVCVRLVSEKDHLWRAITGWPSTDGERTIGGGKRK